MEIKKQLQEEAKEGFIIEVSTSIYYNISVTRAAAAFVELWDFVAPRLGTIESYEDGVLKWQELLPDIQRESRRILRPFLNPEKQLKIKTIQDLIDLIRITPFTSEDLKELLELKTGLIFPEHILQSKKEVLRILEATRDTKPPVNTPPVPPHFLSGSIGEC